MNDGSEDRRACQRKARLLYAQVVKTCRRRQLVQVSHRVVFGTLAGVKDGLAPQGWQINTAFIERINLTIRQHVAAVGRRVMTLCKREEGLRHQLLEQTRDKVIVFAQGAYGIFHMAEYSLPVGVKLKDVPPGIDSHQQVLAKYGLPARR